MTEQDLIREVAFINARVNFLRSQPRGTDGILLSRDYRDEAGTLFRRIEELENIARELA